jgi:hypothetical protein
MKSVRTTLAYVGAAGLVALGLLALLNPLVTVRLIGLEVIDPRGLSEVRAAYGAGLLAMGGAMLWAIPTRPRSTSWLRFAGLLWSAAAAGRIVSVVLDGVWTPLNLVFVLGAVYLALVFVLTGFQRPPKAVDESEADAGPPARRRRGWLGRRRGGGREDAWEDRGRATSSGPSSDRSR